MSAPWLNAQSAAAFVGLSVKTLSNLRALGRGPAYIRYEGGQIVYAQDELERWREARVAERVETRDSRRAHLQAVAS
ncbi:MULTISPECIES: helix-turn-helix transcriptional regulator [unclassified Agrococcus]|uniref:helix-turn-helix transcriptional regulator n=1 Tax=unclassified Agrococcus TaxID=2615065 RepID=UPI003613B775